MKQFPFLFFVVLVSVLVSSCTKDEIPSESSEDNVREKLIQKQNDCVNILEIKQSSGSITIKFDDKSGVSFSSDNVVLYGINEKGIWYKNGQETSVVVSNSSIDTFVSQFKVSGYFLMIIEGYTDWSFYFNDGLTVILKKELFSIDADLIMRSINHRGYSNKVPENTLPAFRMSRLKGFKYVETDVRFTSDGVPVLLHDKTIDRTSNGTGDLSSYSFKQIRLFDFGGWKAKNYSGTLIPSLDEFLELCVDIGLEPNIELKEGTKEQIQGIVKRVEEYGLKDKTSYISFSLTYLKYVADYDPAARIGFITKTINNELLLRVSALRTGLNDVYVGCSDYSPDAVMLCKNAGIPLNVWVLNTEKEILALPDYVSGVTSDLLHAGRVIYLSRNSK